MGGALGVFLLVLSLLVTITIMGGGGSGEACVPGGGGGGVLSDQPGASDHARTEISEAYLEAYRESGRETNVPWPILAGVGMVESTHGTGASSGIDSGTNAKGAAGPMQFGVLNDGASGNAWTHPENGSRRIPTDDFTHPTFWDDTSVRFDEGGVWRPFAVDADGDGYIDVYDIRDASKGAAGYLLYLGIEDDETLALTRYNHGSSTEKTSSQYASDVLDYAELYADGNFTVGTSGEERSSQEACVSDASDMSVEPQEFDVDAIVDLPPDDCVVPGTAGGMQKITPLTCAAHKVIYDRFGDGVHLVHAGRCPPDGFEHPKGRAMDYMILNGTSMPNATEKQNGDDIAEWVMTNHEVLGVMYIIWYNRIWWSHEEKATLENWRSYGGQGLTLGHYDHVHVSFFGPDVVAC
ncbi:hypothetical protein DSY14_04730 [Nocardiopsis sp. MG754419]|nr:hypothetical protein [Nocardiopsis sp. MG754419]